MKTSDNGVALVKSFEGLRLTAYKDAIGVWTIGYGHTAGVHAGQTITEDHAVTLLRADLAVSEKAVSSYYNIYKWNQNEFDALVSFTFNLGAGNLKKLLNNGTRSRAVISSKILEYRKAGGRVLAGLVERRKKEQALFLTPMRTVKKTAHDIALEVIAGIWGNQPDRQKNLESAGYNYKTIQREVNRILKEKEGN